MAAIPLVISKYVGAGRSRESKMTSDEDKRRGVHLQSYVPYAGQDSGRACACRDRLEETGWLSSGVIAPGVGSTSLLHYMQKSKSDECSSVSGGEHPPSLEDRVRCVGGIFMVRESIHNFSSTSASFLSLNAERKWTRYAHGRSLLAHPASRFARHCAFVRCVQSCKVSNDRRSV